jgi:quercetin dioxygenase-like cupin family protein
MDAWNLLDIAAPEGQRDPIVLHSTEEARAVLVVLNPGQALGEHEVKENAWITVVEGTVQLDADGDSREVGPGTLVRFAPGERHAFRTDGGARLLLFLAPWPGAGHYRAD